MEQGNKMKAMAAAGTTGDFDPRILAELRDELGDTGVARVVKVYLESMPPSLEDLRRAVAEGDAAAIGDLAHRMKSSAAALGATGLAAHLRTMEEEGRRDNLAPMAEEFAAVESALKEAITVLETIRANPEQLGA